VKRVTTQEVIELIKTAPEKLHFRIAGRAGWYRLCECAVCHETFWKSGGLHASGKLRDVRSGSVYCSEECQVILQRAEQSAASALAEELQGKARSFLLQEVQPFRPQRASLAEAAGDLLSSATSESTT
jgi:hypothetical protein